MAMRMSQWVLGPEDVTRRSGEGLSLRMHRASGDPQGMVGASPSHQSTVTLRMGWLSV